MNPLVNSGKYWYVYLCACYFSNKQPHIFNAKLSGQSVYNALIKIPCAGEWQNNENNDEGKTHKHT